MPAQGLQPGGQAQQHHPQILGEGQQHLANALGLPFAALDTDLGLACGTLHLHQLAGQFHQSGVGLSKGLGHGLARALQELTHVDQEGRGLHARAGPQSLQDLRHSHCVRPGFLARIQGAPLEQGLCKGARHVQSMRFIHRRISAADGGDDGGDDRQEAAGWRVQRRGARV